MKTYKFFSALLLFVVLTFCFCYFVRATDEQTQQPTLLTNRDSLVPPKLFDFERFKSIFKKSYGSVLEELARKKIFFANAFRAFLSFIGYKNFKKTYYLKVNEMSDWTNEELRSIELKRPSLETKPTTDTDIIEQPAADLEDIEMKLKEIVNEHKNEPGYAEIARELENQRNYRNKRDVLNNKRNSITIDDLFDDVQLEANSEKLVRRVKSNNPNYQAPELDSYGADDDDEEEENRQKPLNDDIQSRILSTASKGFNVFNNFITNSVSSLLGGDNTNVVVEKKPKSDIVDKVYFDHRDSNCLTPVKNQKSCGSCYIFSSTALYEWQYCKETGNLVPFSEQYPLDCGERIGLQGCKGGQEVDVSVFYWMYGVELASNYPYRHRVDSCPYNPDSSPNRMGYLRVMETKMKTIGHYHFDYYIEKMPILLGLGVSDQFHHYGGGVDLGEDCDLRRGHSMLVIGHGIEDGIEYWLMRNSYGPNWGERGHYKLAKTAQKCLWDNGDGFVLNPDRGSKVFGDINSYNDGQAVKDHVESNKFSVSNLFSNIMNAVGPRDSSIATPPPF